MCEKSCLFVALSAAPAAKARKAWSKGRAEGGVAGREGPKKGYG